MLFRSFNIGGGLKNSISIWIEFRELLERISGRQINVDRKGWRPGDQKVYISDITKIGQKLSWEPTISVNEGITKLYEWAEKNRELFV